MVATTFAADTPLAVTGMVAVGRNRRQLAVVVLRRERHADGVLLRAPVAAIRRHDRHRVRRDPLLRASRRRFCADSARCIWAFPINCIILGWVNKAMVEILMLVLGVTKLQALAIVIGMIALTSFISTLCGLWGVLVTDMFQFVIKMGMVIVLAVFAVRAVGGIDAMKVKLLAIDAARGGHQVASRAQLRAGSQFGVDAADHVPRLHFAELVGDLVSRRRARRRRLHRAAHVQREGRKAFAARDAVVQHRALRDSPVAVDSGRAGVADLFPGLEKPETGYIRVMIAYLPPSLRGLMVAAFAAAYMSTIATQLNWGASYLVNDFYRRFLKPNATDRHYVAASQVATVLLTLVSAVVTFYMDSIAGAWKLLHRHRRGNRQRAAAALVLVAHQRVERSVGDDRGVRRFGHAAIGFHFDTDKPRRLRLADDHHGGDHDGGVARGDVPHEARAAGGAGRFLSRARDRRRQAGGRSRGCARGQAVARRILEHCSTGSRAAC